MNRANTPYAFTSVSCVLQLRSHPAPTFQKQLHASRSDSSAKVPTSPNMRRQRGQLWHLTQRNHQEIRSQELYSLRQRPRGNKPSRRGETVTAFAFAVDPVRYRSSGQTCSRESTHDINPPRDESDYIITNSESPDLKRILQWDGAGVHIT